MNKNVFNIMFAVIAGMLYCCTIIGIPFGIGCFRIAKVSFAPLGKKVVPL